MPRTRITHARSGPPPISPGCAAACSDDLPAGGDACPVACQARCRRGPSVALRSGIAHRAPRACGRGAGREDSDPIPRQGLQPLRRNRLCRDGSPACADCVHVRPTLQSVRLRYDPIAGRRGRRRAGRRILRRSCRRCGAERRSRLGLLDRSLRECGVLWQGVGYLAHRAVRLEERPFSRASDSARQRGHPRQEHNDRVERAEEP